VDKAILKVFQYAALVFFWCLNTFLQLVMAGIAAMALSLLYNLAFPVQRSPFVRSGGFIHEIESVGYGSFAAIFIVCFVVIRIAQWIKDRTEAERQSSAEVDQAADLKASYGESASTSLADFGPFTKVVMNGKEFNGGHQMFGVRMRGTTTNTASAVVRFHIDDKNLELRIAQKAYWFSPKQEPLSIAPHAQADLLGMLAHRYDYHLPDRRFILAFISDEAVQRELLPKHPNPNERSTLTIRNGEVTVECVADTKPERSVAEAAAFALMKKLFVRAEIFDRRLAMIRGGRI